MRIVRVVSVFLLITMFILLVCNNNKNFIDVVAANCNDFQLVEFDDDSVVVSFPFNAWEKLKGDLAVEFVYMKVISDREVVECYSPKINRSVVINGRKVNLQVAIIDDKCIVGCPLIKNSF